MLQLIQNATNDQERFEVVDNFLNSLIEYLNQYEREATGSEESVSELAARLDFDGGRKPK